MKALGAKPCAVASMRSAAAPTTASGGFSLRPCSARAGNATETSSPPPVAALISRKRRRDCDTGAEDDSSLRMSGLLLVGSDLDRGTNAWIRSTATDVACHGCVDIGVRRRGIGLQQCRGRHDLARLAVSALHHIDLVPCLLNTLSDRVGADLLDCDDILAHRCRNGGDT